MKAGFFKIAALFRLCTVLTGCGADSAMTETVSDTIDYNDYISDRGSIAYTDQAYFFQDFSTRQITYLDSSLDFEPQTICARANCDHANAGCNAYVDSVGALLAYQNRLYYIAKDVDDPEVFALYRMRLDGTERECVRRLTMLLSGDEARGISYNAGSGGYVVLDGSAYLKGGKQDYLYLLPYDPKEETVVVYMEDEVDLSHYVGLPSRAVGDWVFYSLYTEGSQEKPVQYGYQISTGACRELSGVTGGFLALKDDLSYWYTLSKGVSSYNLETGEQQKVISWNLPLEQDESYYQYSIEADHQYIYMARLGLLGEPSGEEGLTIYDFEGNEILDISYADMEYPLEYLLATPEAVIWGEVDNNGKFTPAYYLERSAIAQGKAEFIGLAK